MELTAAPPSVWFRIKIDQVTYNKVKVRINFFLKVCLKIISLDAYTFPSETVIKLEKKYCKIFQTANPTTMGTKMEYSSVWSEKKQNSTFWDKILVMERNFYKWEVIVIKIWHYKAGVFFFLDQKLLMYVLSIENGKLKKRDGRFFLIPCEDKHPLVGDQSVDEFFQTRVLRYP